MTHQKNFMIHRDAWVREKEASRITTMFCFEKQDEEWCRLLRNGNTGRTEF